MANDSPSARIGVLVEFNYEDLEVNNFDNLLQSRPIAPPLFSHPTTHNTDTHTTQVWYPLLRFREEGMETFTIGPEAGKVYQSKKGYPCKADRDIDSVSAQVCCCMRLYSRHSKNNHQLC